MLLSFDSCVAWPLTEGYFTLIQLLNFLISYFWLAIRRRKILPRTPSCVVGQTSEAIHLQWLASVIEEDMPNIRLADYNDKRISSHTVIKLEAGCWRAQSMKLISVEDQL